MIQEVEELMQHWGEQCRRAGLGSSGNSPLAGLIDWRGAPPRAGRGSTVLLVGAGVDLAAAEVDAAVAALARAGQAEDAALRQAWAEAGNQGGAPFCLSTQLYRLAKVRYLSEPMPLVEQQIRRLKIGGRTTYDRRVHELHERVQAELLRRAEARAA